MVRVKVAEIPLCPSWDIRISKLQLSVSLNTFVDCFKEDFNLMC